MSDPWFKFYPSDWLSGTRGLTPAETGVYVTLICMMYENDGKIAHNDARLARRCGCTAASFKKILKNLLSEDKLVEMEGFLTNERVEKELTERSERVQKSSDAAHKKWATYRQKQQQIQNPGSANANDKQLSGSARVKSQNQNLENNKNSLGVRSFETPLQRVSRSLSEAADQKSDRPEAKGGTGNG